MDDEKHNLLLQHLRDTAQQYAAGLPAKILEIKSIWQELLDQPWNNARFAELHRKLHTVAGSAGTFGFPEVGQGARVAEALIKVVMLGAAPPDATDKEHIQAALTSLETILDNRLKLDKAAVAGDGGAAVPAGIPPVPVAGRREVAMHLLRHSCRSWRWTHHNHPFCHLDES